MKFSTYYCSAALLIATVMAAPINEPSLSILSPVSGEIYASGQNIIIGWTTQENVLLNVSAISLGNSGKNAAMTIIAQDVNSTTGCVHWDAPSNLASETELYRVEISHDDQIISTGQFSIQKITPSTDQPIAVALVDPMSGATASASISLLGSNGSVMAAQNVATSSAIRVVGASMSSGVVALLFSIFFM